MAIGAAGGRIIGQGGSTLSVADIVRLATAGVIVNIGDVVPVPDLVPPEPPRHWMQAPLAGAVWDRRRRSKSLSYRGYDVEGEVAPYQLLASRHGDKVWLSIHPADPQYEPFQLQDDAAIFPSDALMASLALWEREHK